MIRRLAIVAAVAFTVALATASTASATATCSLSSGVLTVNVTGAPQQAALRMEGTEIAVYETFDFSGAKLNCGTSPTTANTNSIAVADTENGSNATLLVVSLEGGPFVNSDPTGEGAGTQEIEITYDGGNGGGDTLGLKGAGAPGHDNWRFGTLAGGQGVQLDDAESDTPDVDDLVMTKTEGLQVGVSGVNEGDDILDARGGAGFTGPATFTSPKQLVGGPGADHIFTGDGNGWFGEGGEGPDELVGGPGNDTLRLSFGADADSADGNGGTDTCEYINHGGSVVVDLRITGPQDTGSAGTDTLSECENTSGGDAGDVLIGTDGNNSLSGGENTVGEIGADTLIGLGGNDALNGSHGVDTVSYAQGSTGPVTVSLATAGQQDTVGAGLDTITNTENLTGSEFSDTLTGNGADNVVDAYDGILDTVNCAGGADTAIADEVGIDALTDCETVDNAPQVIVGTPPADGAVLNDSTPAYPLTADEPATFAVSVDGGAFTACAASCEPPALPEGTHTLTFRAIDTDENLHPGLNPVSRTVTIDTTPDTTPPDTNPPQSNPAPETLLRKPKVKGDDVKLRFSSNESGATFRCKLDRRKLKACRSPKTYKNLDEGKHKVTVVAVDSAGKADPTPAKRKFRIEG